MNKKILIVMVLLFTSAMTGCVTEDDSSKLEDAIESRAFDNELVANQLKLEYNHEVWINDTVTLYNNGERIYKLKMLNEPEFIEVNDERYIHDIEHWYSDDFTDEFYTIIIIPNTYEQRISHIAVKRGIMFIHFDTWKMLHRDYYRFYEGYYQGEEHEYYNENFEKTHKLHEMDLR